LLQITVATIGATTVGTGETGPQLLGWGPTMYWSPQLLGRSFQKAKHFTAGSNQNAGFSIWVFKNFPGVIPPDPHSGRGRPLPHPTPSAIIVSNIEAKCRTFHFYKIRGGLSELSLSIFRAWLKTNLWYTFMGGVSLSVRATGLIPRTLGPSNDFTLLNGWICVLD